MKNYNVTPYFDDFDPNKNYHRVLFKPGQAVQARELTQSQTILQNQISEFASSIFSQNTPISGGRITTNLSCEHIKLNLFYENSAILVTDFEDKTIQTYIWKGNDTVLFLIHGWESNSARWKKALPYILKSRYTVVAIDAPAHGLSSGKDFNAHKYTEFIHHVAKMYNPNILIGHSIGGKACLHYQTIHQ